MPRESCVWRERGLELKRWLKHTAQNGQCQQRNLLIPCLPDFGLKERRHNAERRPLQQNEKERQRSVAGVKTGMLNEPWSRSLRMAQDDDQDHDRLFTLAEANHLIPQLNTRLTCVRQAKAVLVRTKEEIRRASAQADYGGGSPVGPLYIASLQQISANLQAIQELGVLVKDLDLGLCDFPHLRDGRVVFLCWKLGEQEIKWWHETTTGYKDRYPLEDSV